MGIQDTEVKIRTIGCDGPNCNKSVTFDQKDHEKVTAENQWLIPGRNVGTSFGAVFFYCSDTCEMEAAATGIHNPPVPKKLVDPSEVGGQKAVEIAAAAAERARQATRELKAGRGIVKG